MMMEGIPIRVEYHHERIPLYPRPEREGPEPELELLIAAHLEPLMVSNEAIMAFDEATIPYYEHGTILEPPNVDSLADPYTTDLDDWAEEMYTRTYQTFVPSIFDDDMMDMLLQWYAFDHHVQHHTFHVKADQTSECCPICMEPYGTSPSTRLCAYTQCGHHFCCNCLNDDYAVRMKNSCAMCRQPMYKEHIAVTLAELLEFAYELDMNLYELLPHWTRYYGRYATRWFFRYAGAQPYTLWPHEGPWNGGRAFTTLKRLHCHCTIRHT